MKPLPKKPAYWEVRFFKTTRYVFISVFFENLHLTAPLCGVAIPN